MPKPLEGLYVQLLLANDLLNQFECFLIFLTTFGTEF
jgi:hypothetical protein